MMKFDSVLIITHVVYRKTFPFDKIEGPFSSVEKAFSTLSKKIEICHIPLDGYNDPITISYNDKLKNVRIFSIFGYFTPIKYCIDMFFILITSIKFLFNNKFNRLIIAIDPLSCLPLAMLSKIFKFKLIFYSVDFNRSRFKNIFLQHLYEIADEICTRYSDQTWVVCESLLKYKKAKFLKESIYIPNSSHFIKELYVNNKKYRKGNKIAWSGTLMTERHYEILFRVLKEIQQIEPKIEYYLAPINNHDKCRYYMKKNNVKNCTVLELHSRKEWQLYASKCDVGIAIYDDKFGSTEFIEPLKIWDFLMCGLPFIISYEPSVASPILNSGVVYKLKPKNIIPKDNSLKQFINAKNLKRLQPTCIKIAKEFEMKKMIYKALSYLN